MIAVEITLILIGIIAIIGSIIFSSVYEKKHGDSIGLNEEEIKEKISNIVEDTVNSTLDEKIENKMESTEETLEKISNEKILSLNDYSETVINDINKNHEEVMFLYGMLNEKEKDIKNVVVDVENVKKSINILQEKNNVQNESDVDIVSVEGTQASKLNKTQRKNLNEDEEFTDNNVGNQYATTKESNTVSKDIKDNLEYNRNHNGTANKNQLEEGFNNGEVSDFKITVNSVKNNKDTVNKKNNNNRILELYESGLENIQIAKKLGIGIGEVRLVIDLYKNRL